MRAAFVFVNVPIRLPDKAGHGHHACMLALENLAIFTLVWFEVVVQPPLQQFECQSFIMYLFFETLAQEEGSPEQEACSSVIDMMQGITHQL